MFTADSTQEDFALMVEGKLHNSHDREESL